MTSQTIVVLEKQRRWTPELQRRFDGADCRVRGCVAATDVLQSVRDGANIVVLVLPEAEAICLELLGRFLDGTPRPNVVVVGAAGSDGLEWPVRELGAAAFLPETVSGGDLADLCLRLLRSES